jgi:hypothetical protein
MLGPHAAVDDADDHTFALDVGVGPEAVGA